MNISSIYASSNVDGSLTTGKDSSSSTEFQTGEVIEGVITKVSDQISISFSGSEVNVSKSTVQNATEGEIRKFKIMDVSNNSIVLKEVGSSTSNTSGKATWTNVETFKAAFNDYQTSSDQVNSKEEIDSLSALSNRVTSKDYDELIKEGKYLEAYNVTQLDRAIDRIKEQKQVKEEHVESQVEDKKENKKEIKEVADKNQIDSSVTSMNAEEIGKKLEDANLPVTDENIKKVSNALSLGNSVYSMSDKSMGYLIGNDKEPTIENIYKAGYSTVSSNNQLANNDFESIQSQAEDVIQDAGLTVDEDSLKAAKWLYDNGLPLTSDSLTKLETLKGIKQNMSDEKMLNQIVTTMSNGLDAVETSLDDTSIKLATKTVQDVSKITDAAIIKVAQENKEITIQNLVQATEELNASNQQSTKSNQTTTSGQTNTTSQTTSINVTDLDSGEDNLSEVDIKAITAKRQLEEIRLKLTVEAGQNLLNKGISIDTENLQKVVDGLKQIENDYYSSLLKESNVTDSAENIDLLKDTTSKLSALRTMPSYIIGSTLSKKEDISINELYSEGSNLKSRLDKANESYDALMTSPRKDMGDSIQKAFRNVDDILEDMNLEKTQANQRAVKILGYNSMDITDENIAKVKDYDLQVNTLIENLKPAVTVNLIKEGINPLDTPIETLNALTEQVSEELGATEEEKYSEYLWKLDKQQGITESERKSYIGVYRLLNNVKKSDGAAIGSVLNANQDMTLNNLLTAVRTMNSNGVDTKVDDDFGTLESLTFKSSTITEQLSSSFNSSSVSAEEKYHQNLTKSIIDDISPSKLAEVAGSSDIMSMSLESLKEELTVASEDTDIMKAYRDEQVEAFRKTSVDSDEAVSFLKEYNLPTTLEYVAASKEFLSNKSLYKTLLDKADSNEDSTEDSDLLSDMDSLIDSLDSKEDMINQYEKIDQTVSNILKKDLENATITSKDIQDLKALSNSMSLIKDLSNKEYYQIPLAVNGSITNINLTVVKQNEDDGKVSVKVESDKLGNIEANFSVKAGELKGFIVCDSNTSLNTLKEDRDSLLKSAEESGITVKQVDFGIAKQVNTSYIKNASNTTYTSNISDNGSSKASTSQRTNITNVVNQSETEDMTAQLDASKVSTKQLYQIAKAFVLEIKKLES